MRSWIKKNNQESEIEKNELKEKTNKILVKFRLGCNSQQSAVSTGGEGR